jgi:tRNA A37 threonylcarbamoyladenosine dehydratase
MPENSSDSRCEPNPESAESRHHRTVLFYGEAAFTRIRAARVTIVGLGGVGGHAAVNLARSGVGALHLIDFDEVSASSLNRSPFARPADVGGPKTEALAAYLGDVCPDTTITVATDRCSAENLNAIIPTAGPGRPDLVLDAIDSVVDKVALLAWCRGHDIPVVASMGAANKRDVSLVRTGVLEDSRICPLARQVRLGLREQGAPLDIPCIWSLEKSVPTRQRPLPSQMSLPGVFGYGLASLALEFIAREEKQ